MGDRDVRALRLAADFRYSVCTDNTQVDHIAEAVGRESMRPAVVPSGKSFDRTILPPLRARFARCAAGGRAPRGNVVISYWKAVQANQATILLHEPTDAPDYFAGGILGSLGREFGSKHYWNVTRAFILGLITFGVFPVLRLGRLFRDYVTVEQQQLWHLAEWLRTQTGRDEATALRDRTLTLRLRPALSWIPIGLAALVLIAFVSAVPVDGQTFDPLMESTYGYRRTPALVMQASTAGALFALWSAALSFAYAAHWMQVRLHAAEVRRVIEDFNVLARQEGIAPVQLAPAGNGLQPLWLFAAFWMVIFGAVWGVPMMLAGALQRNYITVTSRTMRKDLGHRVRAILLQRRPMMLVPRPVRLTRQCPNEKCRSPLPEIAGYCPRCGAKVNALTVSVA